MLGDLTTAVRAGAPLVWLVTSEPHEVELQVRAICSEYGWHGFVWDCTAGLRALGSVGIRLNHATTISDQANSIPLADSVRAFSLYFPTDPEAPEEPGADAMPPATVLLVHNAHSHAVSAAMVQLLSSTAYRIKSHLHTIVLMSHTHDIPAELSRMTTMVEHPLPGADDIETIVTQVAVADTDIAEGELPGIVETLHGLTRFEVETLTARCLAQHGAVVPKHLFGMKASLLRSGPQSLVLHNGKETFDDVGGFDYLKQFILETAGRRERDPSMRARGIVLTGLSGGGKSLIAKATGHELKRPVVRLDYGAVFGSLMGQSQRNQRELIRRVEAMSPCILWIDEIEKAFAGALSTGQSDSGLQKQLIGDLLTWMQERTHDVYIVATCNDATGVFAVMPEFFRPGRFDAVFFVDMPTTLARERIWRLNLERYGLIDKNEKSMPALPDDSNWTGAEIENCCRLARLRNKTPAVVGASLPVLAVLAAETNRKLREWATDRCFSTEYEGLYSESSFNNFLKSLEPQARRNVMRRRNVSEN